jgi:RNA polymerase sigma-70 factor (ECF subfamily)
VSHRIVSIARVAFFIALVLAQDLAGVQHSCAFGWSGAHHDAKLEAHEESAPAAAHACLGCLAHHSPRAASRLVPTLLPIAAISLALDRTDDALFATCPPSIASPRGPPSVLRAGASRPGGIPHELMEGFTMRTDIVLERPPAWTEAQFTEAVRPHLPALLRSARHILGCEDLARDAVQEALFSLWRAGMPRSDLRGWLVKTVTHRSLFARRGRLRRARREHHCLDEACTCDTGESPHGRLERRELRARLADALGSIPADQRRVFILREVDHLEYAALAESLALPVGTVRSRLHRARAALRREMQSGTFGP